MKVLIIEDEAPAFRRLQNLIYEIDPKIGIVDVIDSVDDAVKWFRNHSAPDLIFMDIQLADGLSFEIFERVKVQSPVIFTTAYDEYTLKAFKVNSVDYLLKPINKDELTDSLSKWENLRTLYSNGSPEFREVFNYIKNSQPVYKSRFLVKISDRLLSITENDIAYFHTKDSVVFMVTNTGKRYVLDQSLDELEELINPQDFFRLNRQFLARIQSIVSIHQYFRGKLKVDLVPKIEDEITVSRERSPIFRKWLDR